MVGVVAASTLGLIVAGPHAFSSWVSALKEQTWQGHALNMSLLGGATRTLQPSTSFGRSLNVQAQCYRYGW